MGRLRILLAVAALGAALGLSTARAETPVEVLLPVPHRSQVDGTVWASSNCGPAAIAMVLEAYGQKVPTKRLRDRANQLLGIADPDTGTRIEDLARVVKENGLTITGPYAGDRFRRWTLEDVRAEVRAGRPVVAQVYYPLLPNHRANPIDTDHYVVVLGLSGGDFIFNDSADLKEPGFRQRMTAQQFTRAWGASDSPFAAFSVGPDKEGRSLLPPTPAPTPTQPVAGADDAPQIAPLRPSSDAGQFAGNDPSDARVAPAAKETSSLIEGLIARLRDQATP